MNTITLPRNDKPDLQFQGDLIASTHSNWEHGHRHAYSLYRFKGGYVCAMASLTQWDGQADNHVVEIVKDLEAVKAFYGQGRLAKDLYWRAKIANVETLD